jgi:hypothetical protein
MDTTKGTSCHAVYCPANESYQGYVLQDGISTVVGYYNTRRSALIHCRQYLRDLATELTQEKTNGFAT